MKKSNSPSKYESVFDGFSVQLTPAPVVRRLAAFIIDSSIIMFVLYTVFFLLLVSGAALVIALKNHLATIFNQYSISFVIIVGFLTVLLPAHIYYIYQEYKTGSTLGKKIFGLKVLSSNGQRITLKQAVIRETLRYVDLFLLIPGPISIWMSDENKRIGDYGASTIVTYSKKLEVESNYLYINQEDYHYFKTVIIPKNVPTLIMHNFKAYAAQELLIKNNYNSPLAKKWQQELAPFIGATNSESFDTTTVLLFFSEHFNQLSYNLNNLKEPLE